METNDDNPSFVNGKMNYFSGNGGLLTRYKIADMHRAGIVSAVASNALPYGTHHDASQSDPFEPTAKTSMWEGMDTDRIPVFVDDQSIPTHDRFPTIPLDLSSLGRRTLTPRQAELIRISFLAMWRTEWRSAWAIMICLPITSRPLPWEAVLIGLGRPLIK